MRGAKRLSAVLLFLSLLVVGAAAGWYALKWRPLWQPVPPQAPYAVAHPQDDTLRLVMLGDSWAGLHPAWQGDSVLGGQPVSFVASGQGGAKSGEVYRLLFSRRRVLERGADYGILIAGINDANACLGTDYYCANYLLLVRHLLACGIRPVVIEVPDVNLECVYGHKPLKDQLCDRYRAWLTGASRYDVGPYREALRARLADTGLADSVLYVGKDLWNPSGYRERSLYRDDQIHLNRRGYQRLDSCLSEVLENDLKNRQKSLQKRAQNSRGSHQSEFWSEIREF